MAGCNSRGPSDSKVVLCPAEPFSAPCADVGGLLTAGCSGAAPAMCNEADSVECRAGDIRCDVSAPEKQSSRMPLLGLYCLDTEKTTAHGVDMETNGDAHMQGAWQ